jgi:4-amino-4-deoxy-L-arabinose transferase-like glycosyltransferase
MASFSPEQSQASSRTRLYLTAIILLWLVVYVPGLFHPPLLDDADSVHAEAAKEMVQRGDWVTLHANGIRYLEKAPLMYWTIAASFKLFGVSEWSARLPLALGVLAMLLVTYALGRKAFGERGGFYSAIILAAGFGTYIFSRILIPDLLVGLWLALGFYFFLETLEQERPSRLACWALGAAAALNVLTKGLIGLVFPIGIIFLFLLFTRNLKHLLELRLLSSTIVFLVIAGPWHILAGLRNPAAGQARGFFWFYFVNEHLLRYLNKRVPRDYDTVPLLVFWGLMFLWLIPWSAFMPQAFARIPHRWREMGSLDREQKATLLFAIWGLIILLFFSFSTRQEYYTIPGLPGFALVIGGWLVRERESEADSKLRRTGRTSATVLFTIGVVVAVVVGALLVMSKPPAPGVELAELLKKNPDEYALSFGHIFDLTPQALGLFRPQLLIVGISFLVGGFFAWFFRRRNEPGKGNIALALMMIAVLFAVWSALREFAPILSSKQLAVAIEKQFKPGDEIVILGEYESGSTLNFYTSQRVHILHERSANLWYGSLFPDAPPTFETNESFAKLWSGPKRIFLWTEDRNPPQLAGKSSYEIAHSGGKWIVSNRPQ